jgi:hypothetical protein
MPNHVTHQMQLRSINGDVSRFLKDCFPVVPVKQTNFNTMKLEETGEQHRIFDFGVLISEPEWPEGSDAWYSWRLNNWGTKWNAYDLNVIQEDEDFCHIKFETAWSAPEPIFDAMAEKYPGLYGYVVSFDEGWCFEYSGTFKGAEGYSGKTQDATPAGHIAAYGHWPEPYIQEVEDAELQKLIGGTSPSEDLAQYSPIDGQADAVPEPAEVQATEEAAQADRQEA